MASLQREKETLKSIIRNSPHRYICPPCFKLFPREDLLNRHISEQRDDTHAWLRKGDLKERTDAEEFLVYYRQSVNTSVAAADIPPAPDCFSVNFVVEHYHSFPHARASLQRRVETLKKIIQVSYIDFVCPICLEGFPRPAVLYDHFRKQGEDTHARPAEITAKEQWEMEMHAGLAKRTSRKQWDMEDFLTCYRQSVRTSIAVEDISLQTRTVLRLTLWSSTTQRTLEVNIEYIRSRLSINRYAALCQLEGCCTASRNLVIAGGA